MAARFESELIKREQKWSPFRRYHVCLGGAGIPAERWALRAHLRLRAEESETVRAAREDHHHHDRFIDLVTAAAVPNPPRATCSNGSCLGRRRCSRFSTT